MGVLQSPEGIPKWGAVREIIPAVTPRPFVVHAGGAHPESQPLRGQTWVKVGGKVICKGAGQGLYRRDRMPSPPTAGSMLDRLCYRGRGIWGRRGEKKKRKWCSLYLLGMSLRGIKGWYSYMNDCLD